MVIFLLTNISLPYIFPWFQANIFSHTSPNFSCIKAHTHTLIIRHSWISAFLQKKNTFNSTKSSLGKTEVVFKYRYIWMVIFGISKGSQVTKTVIWLVDFVVSALLNLISPFLPWLIHSKVFLNLWFVGLWNDKNHIYYIKIVVDLRLSMPLCLSSMSWYAWPCYNLLVRTKFNLIKILCSICESCLLCLLVKEVLVIAWQFLTL